MDVSKLPVGKPAPTDTDCLRIEQQRGGMYKLTASALCASDNQVESVSIVGGPMFASAEAAERAGLAWADDVGVERLYISTGTLDQPLEPTEIDLPL